MARVCWMGPRHKSNPTAAMVGVVDEDGNIILVDEYYKSGLTVDQYAAEVKERLAKWNVPRPVPGICLFIWTQAQRGARDGRN